MRETRTRPPSRPVQLRRSRPPWWCNRRESPAVALPALLRPAVDSLGGLALALVLVVFMLLKREDLRNRFIRLVGHGRMTVTTKAVDDAGQRISRYLLMQFIINGSYGLALTIGLFADPGPACVLVGAFWRPSSAMSPTSAPGSRRPADHSEPGHIPGLGATAPGPWVDRGPGTGPANVMEPWLFSHSMGISEVALLGGRRLLGLPVGAGRAGAVQPADGLPGGAGQVRPAPGVPRCAPG